MKFTVMIATYFPDWEKLKVTLDSIMKQEFTDYEVVICDDGSEDPLTEQIEAYFAEHQFTAYQLVRNEKNQGTVRNLLSGVAAAKGTYIRDFGPGDAFYNEHTLGYIYDFMEEKQCESCFGLMRGYCVKEDGSIEYVDFPHPFDLQAYVDNDRARILRNLILYRDNASGACTCYRRSYYEEYLKRLAGTVIYTEDIFQLMAELDGRGLQFFPDYMVWYEADTGVSTKKKSSFSERLAQDVDRFYEMLQQQYGQNPIVQKQKKLMKYYKIRNLYARTLLRMFENPDSIRYILNHRKQLGSGVYEPKRKEDGFMSR